MIDLMRETGVSFVDEAIFAAPPRPLGHSGSKLKQKDRPLLDCAHNPKVGGSNPSPAIGKQQFRPSQDGLFCCTCGDERRSKRSNTKSIVFGMLTKCSQISKNASLQRLG